MATAATAAPPMASISFQSAGKAINNATPLNPGDCMGRQDWAIATRRTDCSGHSPTTAYSSEIAASRESILRSAHRITQYANTGNGHFDSVARDERPHARRSACGDHVSGEQRHHAGNPANQERHGINHEGSIAGLADRAVDAGFDDKARRIEHRFDVWADGAKSVEALAARELHIALLQIARGDVVEARVAKQIRKCVVRITQLGAAAPDNDGKFAFVFDLFGIFRENNGFFLTDDGSRRLQKNQRLFGYFVAEFGGVGCVIAADANNLRRLDGSKQPHVGKARRVRAAGPLAPRKTRDFNNVLAFDEAVARGWRGSSITRDVAADFH